MSHLRRLLIVSCWTLGGAFAAFWLPAYGASPSLLKDHLLVTWYGNPNCPAMGVLGRQSGAERAAALRQQANAYAGVTRKPIVMAYHLVTIVAQATPCADATWRRRESPGVIDALLAEAHAEGFRLVLDVQSGRAELLDDLQYLRDYLADPDVYLAIDPEFDMESGQVPGRVIGHTHADDVNAAVGFLDALITEHRLPAKVLIVHQFTLGMLPDKARIQSSPRLDVVLDMDGFGSRALKLSSYRAIMRQHRLEFAGIKLFFLQDTNLFTPADVMKIRPTPSVVIYQ